MESRRRRSLPKTPAPGDGVAADAVSDSVLSLLDKAIDEKIDRLTSFLSCRGSSSLSDKGEKIRIQLRHLKEETDRQRHQPARVVDLVLPEYNKLIGF